MMPEIQELTKAGISPREKLSILPDSSWYVFYTCPRSEKMVYQDLLKRGYEVFLPMTKTLRIWKNRQKKLIDLVLFPGYIFVNTYECDLYNIKRIPKVVTYIHCAGKPSIIPAKDIECIKKMLNLNQDVTIENKFYAGEKVRIIYGALAGHEGILIKQKGKTRFGIQLKEINHTVFIEVCAEVLEKA
jgi:transcription antitermination factor NusG